MAERIAEIFPYENPEDYFIPHGREKNASGKLYDTYSNYRKNVRSAGLLNVEKIQRKKW